MLRLEASRLQYICFIDVSDTSPFVIYFHNSTRKTEGNLITISVMISDSIEKLLSFCILKLPKSCALNLSS